MNETVQSSRFQEALETIEALPADEQDLLIEVIRNRLTAQRRAQIVSEVAEAREAYQRGEVRRGTVADLMGEVAE